MAVPEMVTTSHPDRIGMAGTIRIRKRKRILSSTPAFRAPPPDGVVAQRHPISMVSGRDRKGNDHAARANGGLLPGFSPALKGWARRLPGTLLWSAEYRP